MPVIDVHTHAFPDFLAERAMLSLYGRAEYPVTPCYDGTVRGLLETLDGHGVTAAVLWSVATRPEQTENIITWSEQVMKRHPRIIPFPSIHPRNTGIDALAGRIRKAGFKGIKLHPMFQDCAADDPSYFPLYAACRAEGLVVALHAGYDLAFPTDDRAHPRRIARVADAFPGLVLVAAHLGGWRAWEAVLDHLAGRENVYLETSFALGTVEEKLLRRILETHGTHRIMFGTDAPWRSPREDMARLQALDIPPADKERIFHRTACSLLGIRPDGVSSCGAGKYPRTRPRP